MDSLTTLLNTLVVASFGIALGAWLSLWLGVGRKRFYKLRMALCIAVTTAAILLVVKYSIFLPVAIVQQNPILGFVMIAIVTYCAIRGFWEPIEHAFKMEVNSFFGTGNAKNTRASGKELRSEWEGFKEGWNEGAAKKEPVINEAHKEDKVKKTEEDFYKYYRKEQNKKQEKEEDKNYSEHLMDQGDAYVARTHLMSPSERGVYKVMEKAYGEKYHIFCQVRVVDLIQPNMRKHYSWTKEYNSLFRQLSQWHFDYVLCDKDDFRIFCALELDDPSHDRPDRMKRDRILNKACEVAGVRLERMRINHEEKRIELIK